MRIAAATGLAAAAVQAKLLADQEEREVQRLVLAAIESQFKKVNAKLQVSQSDRLRCSAQINRPATAHASCHGGTTPGIQPVTIPSIPLQPAVP
jgi:SWI/SNF related-matrix-associated actin-dependent regulator of chromatin subfamily C